MKRSLIIIGVFSLCTACSSVGEKRPSRLEIVRDGSSFEKAIQLAARTHYDGLLAERDWLRKNLPGSRLAESGTDLAGDVIIYLPHRTQSFGRAIFSIYTMQLPTGQVRDVYFDQAGYLGK